MYTHTYTCTRRYINTHEIIAVDTEKAFKNPISIPDFLKKLSNLGTAGNVLNLTMGIYKRPMSNIIPKCQRLNGFPPLRWRTKQECPLLSLLFNITLKILLNAISQEKLSNSERSEPVLIGQWHNCLRRKSNGIYKKLLELISDFSKVTGYKISIQKSIVFSSTAINDWNWNFRKYHLQ